MMENKINLKNITAAMRPIGPDIAAATIAFWVAGTLSFLPALYAPIFLFLTIPLLFAPSLVAFLFSLHALRVKLKGFSLTPKNNLRLFGMYFRGQLSGSLRIAMGFFKALAFYFGSVFVLSLILYAIGPLVWSDFHETMLAFLEAMESTEEILLSTFLESHPTLAAFLTVTEVVGFGVGSLIFAHHLHRNIVNVYLHTIFVGFPSRLTNSIYLGTIKRPELGFNKAYVRLCWPLYLLFALGYGGGVALGLLLGKTTLIPGLSLIFAFTLSLMYLPFAATGLSMFFGRHHPFFIANSLEYEINSIKGALAQEELSQEERDDLTQELASAESRREEMLEKERTGDFEDEEPESSDDEPESED